MQALLHASTTVVDEDDEVDDPLVAHLYATFDDLPLVPTLDAFAGTEDRSLLAVGSGALRTHCRDVCLDLYAAAIILSLHLLSLETALVVGLSIVSTSAYFHAHVATDGPSFAANLSWTIVSFAVVSPMIMQIRQAFTRRELALDLLAEVKALSCNVLLAHAMWDWGKNERMKLPLHHALVTKQLLRTVLADLQRILTLPTFTRGRHQFTSVGKDQASSFLDHFHSLARRVTYSIQLLQGQVEVMKAVGLPANEASRINQYHWLLQARLEKLCNLKLYRTPQATRSFTRLVILLLPLFYGPYYVYVATAGPTSYGFALTLSVVTSLLMIGIFNVERALEDPFTDEGLDGVKAQRVFARIRDSLDVLLPSNGTKHNRH
ncbi:hypothetical protein SDRG_04212 [Saprolegnia diclina VS20]|uniref:Uncharacterized protein n=1 Tax=Saprolegnia diclina (strain VS20) TaxID=1156394 RepID=T0QWX3_SAPDV|nr:hypothetical protein SDRG_04212 [Saprolegnia diclina VS20]EQC38505.1 hypothetical protein SDRG_04212 [Saprolegnia diclina VS20]|eukprot:XP_008608097.1 hypothetical protein SDRG_04212 [Saprolegnia diclina VS20]